ncbi:MAG: VOC family protein, partial [Elainellaceae cyanobacterium]
MEVVIFGPGRVALQFGQQKINLHEFGTEATPKAMQPTPGSADLCFVTETPLDQVNSHLHACGIMSEAAFVQRTGAMGSILSIYIRDPDGNLLEISNYSPSQSY